jgi:prepilin-type N-terminal cleavage/methylation domain-containing protein
MTKPRGFTIVELLIVIVVIAILAAIVIIAYSGIQTRAHTAAAQSDLDSSAKTLGIANVTAGSYPVDLTSAGLKSGSTVYTYYYNSSANTYCLSGTNAGITYSLNSSNNVPQSGGCMTNGLVGWWQMNGNANDKSGNGNNGAVIAATLTMGQSGQANGAYSFNGTSAYIGLPNSSAVVGNGNYALSAWIKPTMMGGLGIIGWGNWGVVNNVNDINASAATLANGSWHFVLAEFDSITRSLYVDGSFIGSDTPGAVHNAIATNVNIGVTDGSEYFSGSIDDVRVYNRVLSTAEVQALYVAGAQ